MKKILAAILLMMSLKSYEQTTAVFADPSLGDFDLTTTSDVSVDANALQVNRVYKLKLTIFNLSANAIPDRTAKIQIGLGSKMILDPLHDLASSPLNQYFDWTSGAQGGQVQIFGTLKANLPANFDGTAVFYVKPSLLNSSTITGNFLVTNNNNAYTLSDFNPFNNSVSLSYTNTGMDSPLPVTFTSLTASNSACTINVFWTTANQLNLLKYEVETSKDGSSFSKAGETTVSPTGAYSFQFPLSAAFKANTLYIRVKSVDLDGSVKYSKTISVSGNCNNKPKLALFPNPVLNESFVTVQAMEGIFDGRYKVSLIGTNGQLIRQKEISLNGVKNFPLSVTGLASGKYHVRIESKSDEKSVTLDFEKLQ